MRATGRFDFPPWLFAPAAMHPAIRTGVGSSDGLRARLIAAVPGLGATEAAAGLPPGRRRPRKQQRPLRRVSTGFRDLFDVQDGAVVPLRPEAWLHRDTTAVRDPVFAVPPLDSTSTRAPAPLDSTTGVAQLPPKSSAEDTPTSRPASSSAVQRILDASVIVKKTFPGQGDFYGVVHSHDPVNRWWLVKYDDGDQEEFTDDELRPLLPPAFRALLSPAPASAASSAPSSAPRSAVQRILDSKITIRKFFPGHGTFSGVVYDYDSANRWWLVEYDDGDKEGFTDDELRPFLPSTLATLLSTGSGGLRQRLGGFFNAEPPAAGGGSYRSAELTSRSRKRQRGLDAVEAVRRHKAARAESVQPFIDAFFPDGDLTGGTSSVGNAVVDDLLAQLRTDVRFYRSDSTWRKYASAWTRAWTWCSARLRESLGKASVRLLHEHKEVGWAYVKHLAVQGGGVSAITTACTAINFCFKLHNLGAQIMNELPMEMVRASVRRTMGTKRLPKAELSVTEELPRIIDAWGFGEGAGARRQTALMMAIGTALLGRFDDLRHVRCKGMLFFPEGVLFCFPQRKNRQFGGYMWVPLADSGRTNADGEPASTVDLLKLFLTDLGFAVPTPTAEGAPLGVGSAGSLDRFLFRNIRIARRRTPRGASEAEKVYTLGDGFVPLDNTSYGYILKQSRLALEACCGYDSTRSEQFGTHSWRRGGDSALFKEGVSQERRQLLGMWKTPTVELGYVGYTARQHMAWAKASAA